jgi:ABC-type sugar transport system permease subunit
MSPALIGLAVFMVAPILLALWVSFRDWSGLTPLAGSTPVWNEFLMPLIVVRAGPSLWTLPLACPRWAAAGRAGRATTTR